MSDNVTTFPSPPSAGPKMSQGENDAMQAISEARALADVLYNATNNDGDLFMEELGWASLNTTMHIIIEKLDTASRLIERSYRS